MVADEGYVLSNSKNVTGKKKGGHGYNNTVSNMRAIFMARGPNFKKGGSLPHFENVNVYSLLCRLLALEPRPNNGSFEIFESVYIPTNSGSKSTGLLFYFVLGVSLAKRFGQIID